MNCFTHNQILRPNVVEMFHANAAFAWCRGGQLFWLRGHVDKDAFSGGSYLLVGTEASID